MLNKLIKHEFRATARLFLLAYAVVIGVALVNTALLGLKPSNGSGFAAAYSIFSGLMMFVYVMAILALLLMTIAFVIVRFYRMLGDEGYLWFTLPVTPTQQILGKLIPAAVWTIASIAVMFGSIGILLVHPLSRSVGQLSDAWRQMTTQGLNPSVWLIGMLVFIVIALVMQILTFYSAMAVGPNLIKSSRLGGSVVAYIIIYTATQILGIVGLGVMALLFGGAFEQLVNNGSVAGPDISVINHAGVTFGGWFGAEYLVLGVVCFFITRYFIDRKLNLA